MKKMIVAEIRIPDQIEMKQGKTEVAVMSVLWGIVIFVAGVGAGVIGCELMNAPVYDDDEDDWIGECPGFDGDECFELKEEFKRKYLKDGIMMRTADQARFLAEQNRNAKIREQENEIVRSIEEAIEAGKFETTIFREIGRDMVAELRRKGYKVKIHDGGYNEIDTIISWSKDGDPAEKN